MKIVDLMTPDPIVTNPTTPWRTQRPLWMTAGRRLPVVDGGQLVGILTERDIREHLGYLGSRV